LRLNKSITNFRRSFETKSKEYRLTRRSKRKSFAIGFTTSLSLFSMAIFSRALIAYAKDLPIPGPTGPGVVPDPGTGLVPGPTPGQIPVPAPNPRAVVTPRAPVLPPINSPANTNLSGMAGSFCAVAVTTGSWVLGAVCGLIVAAGILHLEKK
jgi:hypothetical protein